MLKWSRLWDRALLCDTRVSPDFGTTAPSTGSVQRDDGHTGWDQRSMSPEPDLWQSLTGHAVRTALTGAQRGQNILENSELETESTEKNCPWRERQCNGNEPNSYINAACNYSEDKEVQSESYRAGLSYKPNILEELKFQECTRINKTRLYCTVEVLWTSADKILNKSLNIHPCMGL